MKKYVSYLLALAIAGALVSCRATYVVRERPAEVVYMRPAPPSREHVWISGDWIWTGGHYQWREGRWEDRHAGFRWIDGHWRPSHGGWVWVPGRWRRI